MRAPQFNDLTMSRNILGFLLPLFIIIWCSEVKAQRVIVVCDLETHTPLRDVHVVTKTNYRDTTDYTGTLHLPVAFECGMAIWHIP